MGSLTRGKGRLQEATITLASDNSTGQNLQIKFQVASVEGKGLGLVAVTAIKRGEQILAERPAFRLSAAAGLKKRARESSCTEQAFKQRLSKYQEEAVQSKLLQLSKNDQE